MKQIPIDQEKLRSYKVITHLTFVEIKTIKITFLMNPGIVNSPPTTMWFIGKHLSSNLLNLMILVTVHAKHGWQFQG